MGLSNPHQNEKLSERTNDEGAPVQKSCLKAPGSIPLCLMSSEYHQRALTHVIALENLVTHFKLQEC